MFRAIAHDFREAFTGLARHLAMALSAASAVMVTLVLVSVLAIVVANVSQITRNIESDIQIYATIKDDVADDKVDALVQQVKTISGVTGVTFSSKDQELTKFIDSYGDDGKIFEIYRNDNPLKRALYIDVASGSLLSQVSGQIEAISGISKVDFGGTTVESFITVLNDVRFGGMVFVIALTVLAMFLISNTIKMTIYARNKEIGIMRQVGASNGYIRRPFVLEGIFIGLLGALVPIALTIVGYRYLYEALGGQLVSGMLSLLPVKPFAYQLSAILAAIGMTVGLIGSLFSVNRYLRWKR